MGTGRFQHPEGLWEGEDSPPEKPSSTGLARVGPSNSGSCILCVQSSVTVTSLSPRKRGSGEGGQGNHFFFMFLSPAPNPRHSAETDGMCEPINK